MSSFSPQTYASTLTSSSSQNERARYDVHADHGIEGEEEMAGDAIASLDNL
jgi:hypothetical protein